MTSFNGSSYNYVTSYVGVPVSLKSAAGRNDTIIASVDTSMVSAYNALYAENNPSIPKGAFDVSHSGIFAIGNGEVQSRDSLYVTLRDATKLKTNTTYLIPVQLSARNGSKLDYSLLFLKMTVTISQLNARMENANKWGSSTSYWRNSTMFINFLPSSDSKGVMIGPDSIRFGVALNTAFNPASVKVDATIAIDDSTINAYSKTFGTKFKPWPADTYELTRTRATVRPASRIGADSLCVVVKNKAKFSRQTWYLLGLKIKRAANDPLSVPSSTSDSSRAFIAFFVL
ncbi:DUF1735 domain-containing protein [Pedobacter sp. P26]|uniref:DUF1735 domain-containing protein n=1 Tax=Pedobacter sp. P26 TaxID=3423956 RepID=UPI003D6762D9